MAKLRVHSLAMSIDGFVAGPDQGLEHPLGVGGERLHEWASATRTFRALHGLEGGSTGVDVRTSFQNPEYRLIQPCKCAAFVFTFCTVVRRRELMRLLD